MHNQTPTVTLDSTTQKPQGLLLGLLSLIRPLLTDRSSYSPRYDQAIPLTLSNGERISVTVFPEPNEKAFEIG